MPATETYHPIHSDFIVHWTGKDIDEKYPVALGDFSKPNKVVDDLYLERLKSILKNGLWMNKDNPATPLIIAGKTIPRPTPYGTCFTELRLSDVRHHASKFGRLGIGFKRFYLFDRMGAPMIYYMENGHNWYVPESVTPHDYSLSFLKGMSTTKNGMIHYSYYDESEWRIIYDDQIDAQLKANGKGVTAKLFEKVTATSHPPEISASPKMPGYLIPIDGRWFAVIIYPSIAAKARAHADKVIQSLIDDFKPTYPGTGDSTVSADYEDYNRPFEMDIDACSNL